MNPIVKKSKEKVLFETLKMISIEIEFSAAKGTK